MNPKLIILSDISGFHNAPWITNYIELLKSDFQLILYDSCKLAGIDRASLTEKELHTQFLNTGIENAINELLKLEKEEVNVLAFSIGGTIAWKAGLSGLKIKSLYAVSSTRLRYETIKPNCFIHLIFGENDPFKPDDIWFKQLALEPEVIKNGQHEIYKEYDVQNNLCNQIKHSH